MPDWYTPDYESRMRAEYERIRAKHPSLVTTSFECFLGWYGIVESYFDVVAQLLAANPNARYSLRQVKEKFGGLRLYADASDDIADAVQGAYDLAARLAEQTCEVCGKPGGMRKIGRGYFATRCDDHADGGELVPPVTWTAVDLPQPVRLHNLKRKRKGSDDA